MGFSFNVSGALSRLEEMLKQIHFNNLLFYKGKSKQIKTLPSSFTEEHNIYIKKA